MLPTGPTLARATGRGYAYSGELSGISIVRSEAVNTVNGLNTIYFQENGIGSTLTTDTDIGFNWKFLSGNAMILGVSKIDATTNTDDCVWSFRDADFQPRDIQFKAARESNMSITSDEYNGAYSYTDLNSIADKSQQFTGGPYSGVTLHSTTLNIDSSQIQGYINGRLRLTDPYYENSIDNHLELWLMSNQDGINTLTGNFCELVILNRYDYDVMRRIEGYLAWKWGVQDKLPLSHEYKFEAPVV